MSSLPAGRIARANALSLQQRSTPMPRPSRSTARRLAATLALLALAPGVHAQVNDPPDVTLPSPAPDTTPGVGVTFAVSVSDPDVGAGNMEMEIDISDLDGVGGLSVPAGQYGSFTWGLGSGTSDVALAPLATINASLANFFFAPGPGYAGVARIVFEIDDQGNTGSGGVLSRTRFIDVDVCVPSELGNASACATNAQPDISLPATVTTRRNTAVTIASVASDVDVAGGNMEMEIDISDLDGVGGRSVPAGDYGTFTWSFGTAVTSDVAVTPLASLNPALAALVYTPPSNYVGPARIVFEIDDQGHSGNAGTVLSRTRFVNIDVIDPPGELRFAGGCVRTVGEGAVESFAVERVNGTGGAASVQVTSEDGSAIAPADYGTGANALSWNAGTGGVRLATASLVADAAAERTEDFTLFLGPPSGATLASPSELTVFVRDVPAAGFVFGSAFEGDCAP
jgi:hypothetical protein